MNTRSEQDLLKRTIQDLLNAAKDGKLIPLVIVINKVEDQEDEEVAGMIEQCKSNVSRILVEANATQIKTRFAVVSATNALVLLNFN